MDLFENGFDVPRLIADSSVSRRGIDRIEYQILREIGLSIGSADIVEFCRDEIDKLITLIFGRLERIYNLQKA